MSTFANDLNGKLMFVNGVMKELDLGINSILEIPSKYAIMTEGKRLRPLICMLCAEAVGGDFRATRDAFIALELIHNGSLVHDDIIDDDLFRRDNPSLHTEFGKKRAVLAGDALLSLGLKYATKTGKLSVVKWLSETSLKMVQGVAMQTFYRRKITSEEKYLDIAYLKSGSLFEAAAALGGLTCSDDERNIDALASFGKNFGIAYQIRDDICDVVLEDSPKTRSDIVNGDLVLPLIYASESELACESDKNGLLDIFLGRTDKVDQGEIWRIYMTTGALEKSVERMRGFAESGRRSLGCFEGSEAVDSIHHLLDKYFVDFDLLRDANSQSQRNPALLS